MKANSILLKATTGIITGVVLLTCLFSDNLSGLIFHSASAAKTIRAARQIQAASFDEGFVISDQQGEIACRDATPDEARALRRRDPAQRLRTITPRSQSRELEQQQTGLKIILRGTPQLDGFPAARAAFLRAAAKWEAVIQTPITVVIDVDFGPNRFGQPFGPNTIGSTSSQILSTDDNNEVLQIRSAFISGASSAQERSLYESLPTPTIPTDLGSAAGLLGPSATLRALGVINPVANPDAEEQQFGIPPRIGFNSAFNFDFDPSDGVGSNQIDFDSTAVHEIGHLLGFVSNVGQRELSPNAPIFVSVWDLFRFRPGVNLSTFSTAQRILSSGGDQVFFDSGNELGLSTGRPDGQGGDGRQASHWKADELTGQYIGIMDPSTSRGARELITNNDLRVIDVLGYRLRTAASQPGTAPVITPPAMIDFGVVAANTQVTRLLTIRNTGSAILNITDVSSQSGNFSVGAITNSFTVVPGGQETILVRLIPTGSGAPSGAISISSNDPARGVVSIPVRATIGVATGQISIVSAASFSGTTRSTEELVASFGQNLATTTLPASLPVPISLAGTTVRVRDSVGTQRDAPLFFVSPTQVNYLFPSGTENGSATVTIISGAGAVSSSFVNVGPVAPGLFLANGGGSSPPAGYVLRFRANGSQVAEPVFRFDAGQNRFVTVPIDLSNNGDLVFLIVFGTGFRSRTNLSAVSFQDPSNNVIGEVTYAGLQGEFLGLDQTNLLLNSSLAGRGDTQLTLVVDGSRSNSIVVNFR